MSAQTGCKQLQEWIAWLEQLNPDRIELGLERVRRVWQQFDRQIDSTVITIGGTNGKGSVVAMLEQVLLHSGRSVIAYTSPHLLRFNERIRIDGMEVTDATLVKAFSVVAAAQAAAAIRLTYFEFTTLAALWLISEQRPDVALLEVGLGGRLDAVNIIDADAAVLTSIGMDHMNWLGNTRDAIAGEKVAIARPHRMLICGDTDPPPVIRQRAADMQAHLLQIGMNFDLTVLPDAGTDSSHCRFSADWLQQAVAMPLPVMTGQHQRNNMACVMALLSAPGSPLLLPDLQQVTTSLAATRVVARQQRLRARPELIVDVAHNEPAVVMLVDKLRSEPVTGRTLVVLAMLADKDIKAVVNCLQTIAQQWLLPQISGQRALPPQQLQQLLLENGVAAENICCYAAVKDAVSDALQQAQEDDRIVVLGSFVTAAALLADWTDDD